VISTSDLKKKLIEEGFKLVIIVGEDLTSIKFIGEEIKEISNLGIMGFAFKVKEEKSKLMWLKIKKNVYQIGELAEKEDFNLYVHVELYPGRYKLREVLEKL